VIRNDSPKLFGVFTNLSDQYYKVARGNGLNEIYGNEYKNASYVEKTIEESHEFWKELIHGEVDSNEINYNQTSTKDADSYISKCETAVAFDIPNAAPEPAAAKPEKYNYWYYLDKDFNLIELPSSA
jgi:inorganic pyrophosphatase